MGKRASAVSASCMITHFSVTPLVVVGVAGGATDRVSMEDICTASSSFQHHVDARRLFPQYEIPLLGVRYFDSSADLEEKAKMSTENNIQKSFQIQIDGNIRNEFLMNNIKIHLGVFTIGNQFIGSQIELNLLKNSVPNLVFVEIEGASLLQV
ncbi:MAG: hypothetical protein ACKVOU_00085 [Cytophagales bacterium]